MKPNVKVNCQSSMLLAVTFLLSKCSSFYIQNTIPMIHRGVYVSPSPTFNSIRPHYWSKCISYVVSAEPRRSKVVNALVGLSISNFFGALFTGLRGAMFWISGTEPTIITCIHRQLSTKGFYYLDICNHVL